MNAICITGIKNEMVAFKAKCAGGVSSGVWIFRAAFSADGGFTPSALFKYICPGNYAVTEAWYGPMQELFLTAEQQPPFHVKLGWQLGSSCFSCPGTKVSITISKETAEENSESIESALSLTGSLSPPGDAGGLGGELGFSISWLKSKSRSLTNGNAHTIEAECNAFNLYY